MRFLLEYLKHPRTVGAVAPSGKSLSRKMMEAIDFSAADIIAEYGPGTGSFTKELIARRKESTVLILIEQNDDFVKRLKEAFGDQPNLYIIRGSAENINEYLGQYGFSHADYVVSGLPFSSLPASVSKNILAATANAIGESGTFITFQYTLVKRRLFERYFKITCRLRVIKNLPPAHVLIMNNTHLIL